MRKKVAVRLCCLTAIMVLTIALAFTGKLYAHCDTLDGPVVKTAQKALSTGDITPVLKWVRQEDEKEIKALFQKTIIVRAKGKEAQELADMYFLETLVRLHRAGEGVPYTGLKPAEAIDPAVTEADKALEGGSAEILITLLNTAVSTGIQKRFNQAKAAKEHADRNVEAGREFVEAYVQFTHYVEKLHKDAVGEMGHQHDESTETVIHKDHH